MSTRIDSISTLISSFPIPELSRIAESNQKPSYASILTAQKELNANAASVESTQGTGIHGHLVLTMPNTAFLAMTVVGEDDPIPHPAPRNPGQLGDAANAAQARAHEYSLYHFKTYHSTDQALKKQLLAACPDIYLSALKHTLTGYASVTTLMMLTHLKDTYGKIRPEDLDLNLQNIATPWHPTTPIENLFLQIDDGIEFARAGNSAIDDNHAVRIIYNIILNTGVFELPCREWRARPDAEKTLRNFKTAFQAANEDRSATTASVGYHPQTAHAAVTTNDTLAALLASNTELHALVKKLTNNQKAAKTTTTSTRTPIIQTEMALRHKGYCHTHGTTHAYNPLKIHTSETCRFPGPNHNKTATEENKMGGSEKIWTARVNPPSE